MASTVTQKSLVVAAADAGERLDRVLARHVAELSRSRLKALIEAGAVALDSRPLRDPRHRGNSAAGHWTGALVTALIAHCGDSLSGIGGERRPGIVHRLDKDTSGLMVVAKNDRAHRALAKQFADHGRSDEAFERGYLAFVWDAPERPHGTIDKPLDRDTRARDRMAVREGGREAITHWQVLERYRGEKPAKMTAKGAKPEAPVASLLL